MDEYTLKLDWAYGYRGAQCRNNLHYNKNGEIVYFLAGICIVHNVKSNTQKYYFEHNDDILCLTIDPSLTLVASGQAGQEPYVCIWDSTNQKTVSILKDLGHASGVGVVAFSPDAQLFLSVGIDDQSTVIVWDLKKAKPVAKSNENAEKVFDGQFHPTWANTVVTCGLQHVTFWRLCGNVLSPTSDVANKVETVLCLAFGPNGVTFAGGLSGNVLLFQKDKLEGSMSSSHQGGVFCIYQTQDGGYLTGGKDGDVKLWDPKFKAVSAIAMMTLLKKQIWIRALCCHSDRILVGTQDSEIYELILRDRDHPVLLVAGHSDKELWALAAHPKKPVFATGADDMTIRVWNTNDHCLVEMTTLNQWIRSLAYSNDGTFLAAGLSDGSLIVYKSKDFVEIVKFKDRKRPIAELKFSPNNEYLAAGCNDGCVDVYVVNQKFKHLGACQSNGNNVTHLDWSEDSKIVQVNTGDGQRVLYKIPSCKPFPSKDDAAKGVKWATWTCVIGQEVDGIRMKNNRKSTVGINAVDVNVEKKLLAAGGTEGVVKMYKFPTYAKDSKCQKFMGHSSDVTNVRWAADGLTLVSLGGTDNAIFQWRLVTKAQENKTDNMLSKHDSDSDNEPTKAVEIDSDVEKATNQSRYTRFVGKEKVKKYTRRVIRMEMKQEGKKRLHPPTASLQLAYVFGYRGYDCFNNIYFSQHGEIIYHIASVGVVMSRDTGQQKFYIGHTDDILCMSIHPQKDIIASGQIGKTPVIHVWDVQTLKAMSMLKGQHTVGVYAVDFSGDGKRLVSVGMDDNHCIVIWDWKKGEKLALARGHKDKIFGLAFNPKDPLKLTSVGVRHIKFWTHAGSGFTSVRGVFGSVAKMETMLCITYSQTAEDTCFSGAADGTVYVWVATKLIRTVSAHKGPCFAIFSLEKGFVTGGKDGQVSLWDEKCEKLIKQYPVQSKYLTKDSQPLLLDNPVITAATLGHNKIIAGTKNGEILEIDKSGILIVLMQGHCEGELWGLAVLPNQMTVATASDDGYVKLWNCSESLKRLISHHKVSKPARSVALSPDGKFVAVGFKDGSVVVLRTEGFQQVHSVHHRKESISDIKYSPDGKYFAVGSHDNFVDIYDSVSGKRTGICKGSSSYITHVDWDETGNLIRSNSGAREELYFQAPSGTREPLSPTDVDQNKWSTWTSVLGPYCNGIWPPNSDITDVNCACLHPKLPLLVTGDDLGFVKLFNFPTSGKYAKYKDYLGHAAHVTSARFSSDGNYLFTIGGADTALLIWKVLADKGYGQSETSDTDSEEEGEYDSEVEYEKKINYKGKTFTKEQRSPATELLNLDTELERTKDKVSRFRFTDNKIKVVRLESSTQPKNKKKKLVTQIGGLKLEHIFGYRGFDCSNNLFYISDGSEIVYHAAGAGIIMNLASGQQRYYLEHTDDIISLNVNQNQKYNTLIATGQIDQTTPTVRIWDYKTLKTLSILKCNFSSGPNCLEFSPSGKYLIAVGIDEEHTITIWKWQDGTVVATGPGYVNRIFDAKFRPDSDTSFVTAGIKHLKFWQICGSEIVGKKGVIKPIETSSLKKMYTMLSIAFAPDKITYTGCITGDICIWKEETLIKTINNAHTGPVFVLYTTLSDGLIVSGSKENKSVTNSGHVKLWDQQMQRCKVFNIQPLGDAKCEVVKSLCRHIDKIIVGTKNCDIIEIQEQTAVPHFVMRSHGDGTLVGLTVHPSQDLVATASFDRTLRVWDVGRKTMLSLMRFESEATCCQFTPDGGLLAAGFTNGEFVILHSSDSTTWAKKRERGSSITTMKFSPDGKSLAVGYQESAVDLFDLGQGPQMKKICYIKDVQNRIKFMDFSSDGSYLKVCSSKQEVFVFKLPEGVAFNDEAKINDIIWATWTTTCGKEVAGIWHEHQDQKSDVNCADVAHISNILATGDDCGFVKLFPFPCSTPDIQYLQYSGHSSHVTNVRFSFDDSYLITVGGDDSCMFVWKCLESSSAKS